tara:strand:+ start:1448 stop:1615 length:168 start_codon:yes stop_codon:yes gene_type:complete
VHISDRLASLYLNFFGDEDMHEGKGADAGEDLFKKKSFAHHEIRITQIASSDFTT